MKTNFSDDTKNEVMSDLLAQVAGTLGDNRRLYSAPTSTCALY